MSVRSAWLAVLIIGLSVQSLHAKQIRTLHVAGWDGAAYANDTTGAFTHCSAGASYRNGAYVMFSVTRDYDWGITFGSDSINLTPGVERTIDLSIDGRAPSAVQAKAITEHAVLVPLATTKAVVDMFRQGNVLSMTSHDLHYDFNLDGSAAVINTLVKCVKDAMQPIAMNAPNQIAVNGPASAQADATRSEALSIMANILGAAGVVGFHIEDQAPGSGNQVLWKAANVVGSLMIDENSSPETAIGLVIGAEATSCKGKFVSGTLPQDADGNKRAFVVCSNKGSDLTTNFTAVKRSSGGSYVFALMGKPADLNQPDSQISQALHQASFRQH